MGLARYEKAIQDEAGNLITASGFYFEVRREDAVGSPKKPIYADRDGTTPLSNPSPLVDGVVAFHAVGGPVSVRVYGTGYDETFHYQAIGTGSETDVDTLLIPGYLFDWESETSTPPSDGCIRGDDADLSLASKLYVSKTTIAGSDVETRLLALDDQRVILTTTSDGGQTSFFIDSVTDHTGYVEFAVSGFLGEDTIPVGRVGLQKEGAQGEPGSDGAIIGTEVIYTSASNSIGTSVAGKTLIANSGSAIAFNIDASATLGDEWMVLVRNIGAGTLTLDPDSSETIDGAATVTLAQNESCLITCNGSALRTLFRTRASVLLGDTEDQTITGGARVTPKDLGNLSGASITPDPGDRSIQKVTNNGAGSILPGSNTGQYTLQVINTTGAGAITTTGWTLKGDSFDTTTTSKFACSCLVTSDIKLMTVVKVA